VGDVSRLVTHALETARAGAEALAAFEQGRPDLVLLVVAPRSVM